jgi:hypothetical protein
MPPKLMAAEEIIAMDPQRNIIIGTMTAGENSLARMVAGMLKVQYGM